VPVATIKGGHIRPKSKRNVKKIIGGLETLAETKVLVCRSIKYLYTRELDHRTNGRAEVLGSENQIIAYRSKCLR
jgi:hypothetical protein